MVRTAIRNDWGPSARCCSTISVHPDRSRGCRFAGRRSRHDCGRLDVGPSYNQAGVTTEPRTGARNGGHVGCPGLAAIARPIDRRRGVLLDRLARRSPRANRRADRITLRGGGQVRGKLIPDKAHPDQSSCSSARSARPRWSSRRTRSSRWSPEKGPLDEYVVLRDQERPTAQAEYDLGVWCEEHELADLAQVHYRAGGEARQHLRPRPPEARPRPERTADGSTPTRSRRPRGWSSTRGAGSPPRRRSGRRPWRRPPPRGPPGPSGSGSSATATSPARPNGPARPSAGSWRSTSRWRSAPVLRVLGEDPIPALRVLAARVLGRDPRARRPPRAWSAGSWPRRTRTVRQATMDELARRDPAEVVPILLRALRSTQPEVVNRAAWGLANLNAVATVPRLVPALITIEYEVVMVDGGPPSGNRGQLQRGLARRRASRATAAARSRSSRRPAVGPGVGRLRRDLGPLRGRSTARRSASAAARAGRSPGWSRSSTATPRSSPPWSR